MDVEPNYKWSFHVEVDDLADELKNCEDLNKIFGKRKKKSSTHQFSEVSDFKIKPADGKFYLLSYDDEVIKNYFLKLLLDENFQNLTNSAIDLIDKAWNKIQVSGR